RSPGGTPRDRGAQPGAPPPKRAIRAAGLPGRLAGAGNSDARPPRRAPPSTLGADPDRPCAKWGPGPVTATNRWNAFERSTGAPIQPEDGLALLDQAAPPIGVLDIEIGDPLPSFAAPDRAGRPKAVLALVRLHTH